MTQPETTSSQTGTEELFQGDERLDQLHRVLLMMLKDFAALCESQGFSWIAMYGTAIGALRHGGFIPWDDDLDICMTRADLDALTALVNGENEPPALEGEGAVASTADATAAEATKKPFDLAAFRAKYCVINSRTHAGYPMMTYRLMLKGTEFRDSNLATMDFPSGIFLDLFPLDVLAADEGARKKQIDRSWFYNKLGIAKLTANPYIGGKGLAPAVLRVGTKAARSLLNLPGIRSFDPNAKSLAWLLRYQGQETGHLGYPCDTNRYWDIYETEDLFPLRWVAFEDTQVPLANKAEKLLSSLYGNWQTPPPNDARIAHYPDVLDFGEYANV